MVWLFKEIIKLIIRLAYILHKPLSFILEIAQNLLHLFGTGQDVVVECFIGYGTLHYLLFVLESLIDQLLDQFVRKPIFHVGVFWQF